MAGEAVTEANLRCLWQNLTVPADFFKDGRRDTIKYFQASPTSRKFYFSRCEIIDFQDINGHSIWTTKGDGEIALPANIGVFLLNGTWREG
ncbi:hypothetical protein BU24DRAFT_419874 [Aaosphaeria arxii CBS 175.79]|uniref:Uncharacterized protein n=1 Tax=Aaosphaeria arxii CBS 175.79 TaxID=1450172 RepID=A0A6A5Y701_9PLEO|nr:uncharacterized protein BU24DRAFT_419874 [Aaosphaeria arxii CBS 175.79]KAF2020334.1 hypothetical protein BU24DRAFT_419874 [Aaosphaeria arxii CBS 175.79]